ncbi:DNA recombination protein RmuC [Ekhidna lutea]|uniref:DNA recombination protein RmuC n=1 Tax=Ekhidna lutea TaxID=447679 RepID=A0A239F1E8_EKHLU|nr:DNA recombination protein RmuC [Ekhidna lutea]SNS50756.1 DNA recombination protein RmuC [Ekhidna lutea]
MELSSLMFLIVGLALGVPMGWLLFRVRSSSNVPENGELKIQLKLEMERSKKLAEELQQMNNELRSEREEVIHLNNQNSTLKANYQNLQTRLEEQKGELGQLQEKFTTEFKNLANEIFEEKSKKFTDQNKTNLHELLNPLGQKLTEFEKKVEQTNKESLERSTALREQIIGLRELNDRMTKEAENLTKALKGDVKMQGNWGEVILERILEKSGLEKDREYIVQETLHSEAGRRLRPDVIIKLPDNKNLVIDAKMSLVAYEKYMNEEDELKKEQYLKDHILSVKAHVKGLAEKNYHQLFDGGSLDYVLMFVPIESAFSLVVQHGGELYNDAHEKSIIIVSPATLIATLRTVSSIWKHEYQNKNALEIARQGGALYDKFKAFVDDLIEVGKSLDKSKQQYGQAMNKLVEGKDNLIRKTERLKELGSKTSRSMDEKLLYRAGAKDEDDSPELF